MLRHAPPSDHRSDKALVAANAVLAALRADACSPGVDTGPKQTGPKQVGSARDPRDGPAASRNTSPMCRIEQLRHVRD